MGRFEDMTIERPPYLTNKQGRSQRSAVGNSNFDWVLSIFDDMPDAQIKNLVYRALDNLPALPDDPSLYPAGGGLFRNGDQYGYTLTRMYGSRAPTGNKIVDAMLSAFDAAPAIPDDPLAYNGLPAGYYRNGDANGYTIVRKT
jgi:hypothetical protein